MGYVVKQKPQYYYCSLQSATISVKDLFQIAATCKTHAKPWNKKKRSKMFVYLFFCLQDLTMRVLFQAFHLQNGQNLQKVILRLLGKKKKGIQGSAEQKYQEHFQY